MIFMLAFEYYEEYLLQLLRRNPDIGWYYCVSFGFEGSCMMNDDNSDG